jgi:hypothetical protein
MGSSPRNRIYDRLRQEWVAATPEELVRQELLGQLIDSRGYPKERIAIEVSLRSLHSTTRRPPARRLDILCFDEEFQPLLLVECKAVALTPRVLAQVVGYNHWVGAPIVLVANADERRIKTVQEQSFRPCTSLPAYGELLEAQSKLSTDAVANLPLRRDLQ